jgi:hypothetical protein
MWGGSIAVAYMLQAAVALVVCATLNMALAQRRIIRAQGCCTLPVRHSRRGIALAAFIPVGVITVIAVYVAVLRRGAIELSEPTPTPATATR